MPPDQTKSLAARMNVPLTLSLAGVENDQRGLVGGKAANLGVLIRAKLPVPPGFCVTVTAFNQFLDASPNRQELLRILPRLSEEPPERIRNLSQEITDSLADVAIPVLVEQAILTEWREFGDERVYAVRSSATVEDAADHSFAGLFESYLNVQGRDALLSAIRKCWLSLYSARALSYLAKLSLPADQVGMAVVVQEMVPAETAGVLFTADPATGDTSRLVIEAASGSGENVVSGRMTPECFVLDKASMTVLKRTAGSQSGTSMVLDDQTAQQLGTLSQRVEQILPGPLDIEWALCGGGLHLLQARPITGRRKKKTWEERQIWTNANVGETLPDVITPMTYSMLMPLLQGLCGNFFSRLGYRIQADQLIARIGGRVYFNVNTCVALLKLLPAVKPEDIGEIFGGAQEHDACKRQIQLGPDDLPRLKFNPWLVVRRLPKVLFMIMRFYWVRNTQSLQTLPLPPNDPHSFSPESCSNELLVQTIRATLPTQELGEEPVLSYMGLGAFHLVLLLALSKRWFDAEGSAIAARLTTGLGTMAPAQAGRDLWNLAEVAALHPELRRAVAEETDFGPFERRLQSITAGRAFLDQWNGFLSRHGHHTRGEVELINPRWSETPDVVLGIVRNYLEILAGNLNTPATRLTELGEQRRTLEKECLDRLKNPIKRGLFRWLLRHAQRGVAIKENVKSESVRRLSQARLQLLELGRRLVPLGRCADPNDVFFLTVDELRSEYLFGSGEELRKIVAARRAEYARYQKLHPPPVVFGCGNPDEWQPDLIEAAVDHLEGLPASPGVATGRARVLLEIDPRDRVLAGEILVAPSTDPAWSPYFLTAAGIVIDLGGMLSHGSILAREYGLPAVTNVGSATRIIRTGDIVQVDGNRGLIHILERSTPQ